jgi:hypothetical protein
LTASEPLTNCENPKGEINYFTEITVIPQKDENFAKSKEESQNKESAAKTKTESQKKRYYLV